MNKKTSEKGTAYLYGNPIFSLVFEREGEIQYFDLTTFRPNPKDYLSKDKKYKCVAHFSKKTLEKLDLRVNGQVIILTNTRQL